MDPSQSSSTISKATNNAIMADSERLEKQNLHRPTRQSKELISWTELLGDR